MNNKKLSYNPQIDVLRFFAAFIVITHHFYLDMGKVFINWYGEYGVEIFFCLSGFLITSILLSKKNTLPKGKIIKDFIIRRILRLFPAYYLFLFGMILLSLITGLFIGYKEDLIWYFSYLSNYMSFFGVYPAKQFDHLWTLSIEEQFYIVWPFIILSIPKKNELIVILSIILIGLISKYYLVYNHIDSARHMPIYHFDTIGLGALLAYLKINQENTGYIFLQKWKDSLLIIFSILFFSHYIFGWLGYFFYVVLAFFIFFLIVKVHFNFNDPIFKKIFENNVLQYLGKISYGLYLFHKPIPSILNLFGSKINFHFDSHPTVWYISSLLLVVLIASISFKLIESPLLRLKQHFQ